MKINKTILGAILVLALIVLVSATTVSVMTVKPAPPVSVFCKVYRDSEYARDEILKLSKQGWIVKQVSTSSDQYGFSASTILVMEKY